MNRRPDPMDDDPPTSAVNPRFWLCIFGFWSLVLFFGWLLS